MSRLVYGIRPVSEALRHGASRVHQIWLAEGAALERLGGDLARLARSRGIEPQAASRAQLESVCGSTSHQGIVAVVGEFSYCELEDLVETPGVGGGRLAERDIPPLLLAVDGVTDPQNLGAMLRAALVLGATGVVLTKDRCAAITPTVVRVSSGASEHLPCARVTNLSRALRWLRECEVWIAGAVEQGGIAPAEASLTEPTALVLGGEERGIRPGVLKSCDLLITIPTLGPITALNVGTATAVLFYEARRQRMRGQA